MSITYVGVDVGLTGALAWICEGAGTGVFDLPTVKLKKVEYMERELFDLFSDVPQDSRVVIESQQAFPGQGLSSSFNLGVGWGLVRMAAVAAHLPYENVTPVTWKRAMGIPAGSDKDASRLIAQRLFPELADSLKRKKDHGRADALLIAEWRRRKG